VSDIDEVVRAARRAERERMIRLITADANFEPSCAEDIGFYDGLMRAARLIESAPEDES
jgi:hypothetical protein